MKAAKSFLAGVVIFALFGQSANVLLNAALYSDVTEDHWAYQSVERMADKGLMVGNLSGEYKPDNPLDKFETTRILALSAGYKYSGASESEQSYFDRAYEKNKMLLNTYGSKYSKWNTTVNREIAYLIEKEIFAEADLDHFIVMSDGQETLRALSKQEAAMYLAKLMEKKQAALGGAYSYTLADDALIDAGYKPYVYYMVNAGVMSAAEGNVYNPKEAVSRAAMAVMLDKTVAIMESEGKTVGSTGQAAGVVQIETVMGAIDSVYTSLGAIEVVLSSGESQMLKVEPSASIYVDGFIKTIFDLKEGMPFVGILNNNSFVDIKAQAINGGSPAVVPENIHIYTDAVQGTVKAVTQSDNGARSVTLEIKVIESLGSIVTENNTYLLDSSCDIKRGSAVTTFDTITNGEVINARVANNVAYSLEITEKDRQLQGTVTDRRMDAAFAKNIYVVTTEAGDVYQFTAGEESVLTRNSEDNVVVFGDIKIGDSISLTAEYTQIIKAHAQGAKSSAEGVLSEVHILKDYVTLGVSNASGFVTRYKMLPGVYDPYALKINTKVLLRLDSQEIEGLSIIQEAKADFITGYIDSSGVDHIMIKSAADGTYSRVNFNNSTAMINGTTGEKITPAKFLKNNKVYIIFTSTDSDMAKSIAVLGK